MPDWVSHPAKDLIYRMLIVDPNKRISVSIVLNIYMTKKDTYLPQFNDILLHPWMQFNHFVDTPFKIHSFSFQNNNPWLDEKLKSPILLQSNDLDGPTRETLKVLWRDLSHDQIITALQENE